MKYAKPILAGVATAVLVILFGILFFDESARKDTDPLLDRFLAKVSHISLYRQHVETDMAFPDRHLHVSGNYLIDRTNARFSSVSTTTVTLPDSGKPVAHDFTLANVSLDGDVYNKIETKSPVLIRTIPVSDGWRHFKANAIPPTFKNIAIPGPLLDNLLIFGSSGEYLTFLDKTVVADLSGKRLTRYRFKLGTVAPPHSMGTLRALMARIGVGGTVEAYLDPETAEPLYLHFANAMYSSTTTLSALNAPLLIEKPTDAE